MHPHHYNPYLGGDSGCFELYIDYRLISSLVANDMGQIAVKVQPEFGICIGLIFRLIANVSAR